MSEVLFDQDGITLIFGNSLEMDIPTADLILTDPPYATTALVWDKWPKGWLARAAEISNSMWCFGAMRMFLEHAPEFLEHWKHGQEVASALEDDLDVLWEKQNGTGFATDRFRRVHEHVVHFYNGKWEDIYKETQMISGAKKKTVTRRTQPGHTGFVGDSKYESWEGGPKLMRSVIHARNEHYNAIHPTQKPASILIPLIKYSCPVGGLVVDLFGGSASTAIAAKECGRRALIIEANEEYAQAALQRLEENSKALRLF